MKSSMKFYIIVLFIWTLLIVALIFDETKKITRDQYNIAKAEAIANFNKNQAIRSWVSSHGGVYIRIDSLTPPNPYLSESQDRDIETPSGIKLTLMNPAYLLRHLNDHYAKSFGIIGHLTSKDLLRPENEPDNWELDVLDKFEAGVKEVSEYGDIDGEPFLRYMKPLLIEQECLNCHSHQGYKVGDIRGGLSISIPMQEIINNSTQHRNREYWTLGVIWLIGFAGITFGYKRLDQNMERLKTINNELILAKDKAEESDRLKTAFLDSMSHEIRTPLNAIIGFSEIIADASEDPELKDFSNLIYVQNELLLQLVNDILDHSQIEAGVFEVKYKSLNLNELVDELDVMFRPKCPDYISLIPNKITETIQIKGDIIRLRQIFYNLISNAIKFTAQGTINFGFELDEDDEIRYFVNDTGIGISAEKQKFIFERFTKLDMLSQGTGLGLSIVKNIVEVMGGTIWLKSELGKGSIFYFKLPFKKENP